MNKPDPSKLTKCPLCNGDLYAYSLMGINGAESSYCPKCNIVRESMMSIPVLCSECNSRSLYRIGGKCYCWFCGSDKIVGMKTEEAEKKGLFETEGFKLSSVFIENKNKCKHEHVKNIRHNDVIFKFTCEDCGRIEFINIPKWLQEEKNIGDTIM